MQMYCVQQPVAGYGGVPMGALMALNIFKKADLQPGKKGKKVRCVVAVPAAKDLETIKGLIDADGIKTVVDRSFPLEEASGAHRYVEQGERKGPVVIVMKREGGSDGK